MCHYMNYEEKALQLMGYTINDCLNPKLYLAVFNHRKMWIYIAKTYAQYLDKEDICVKNVPSINKLKEDYIASGASGYYYVYNNCFLCDYARTYLRSAICRLCPLIWGKHQRDVCGFTQYREIMVTFSELKDSKDKRKTLKKMVKLAYKIADLPERKNNRKELTIQQKTGCALMNHMVKEITKCITTT